METIHEGKWHWYDIMGDLKKQGGLKVIVAPLSTRIHSCDGKLNDNKFSITWVKDKFLLVTMEHYSDVLIKAFEVVLEYSPFCRYIHKSHNWPTVEWDKVDPKNRYVQLSESPAVKDLTRLP